MKRIPTIPKVFNFSKIETLSPSKYTSLKQRCIYSYLLEKFAQENGRPSFLMPPMHYKNNIGTVIHKILEKAYSGLLEINQKSIEAEWKKLIQDQKQHVMEEFPLLRNVVIGDYDAMFQLIDTLAKHQVSHPAQQEPSVFSRPPYEYPAKIPNLLYGKIDKIAFHNGTYEIIDYKTGKIFDDNGDVKQDYKDQLNLYAYMLEESDGFQISKLTIIDTAGNEIDVPYESNSKQDALEAVRKLKEHINTAIESNDFAHLYNNSPEICSFCRCQHICPYFKISGTSIYHVVSGTVEQILNDDQLIVSSAGERNIIAKLRVWKLEKFNELIGRDVVFVNLLYVDDIDDQHLYYRCDNTMVYFK